MSNRDYQICKTCVMDTSDSNITFDSDGVCEYCNNFQSYIMPNWHDDERDSKELEMLSNKIRKGNKSKEFNCIIGLSGGLDSSYAAHVAVKKMKLKPLLVHVDAGWNTKQAVENIKNVVDGLGLDLYTDVVNWDGVKRMQLAFLKSGISDVDLVQDAAFFSGLYRFARKYKIKHIITGSNYSTECCREPEEWGGYLGVDSTLFADIWNKCGDGKPNRDFPLVDIFIYKIWYQRFLGMKVHHPLNHTKYIKKEAEKELNDKYGWKPFQHKHHESRFTRFYEDFWMPKRFGYEKRRAHLSSLIMTNQMIRADAIKRLEKPELSDEFHRQEFEYVATKLGISEQELHDIFNLPKKTYRDYKNKRFLIVLGANILRYLGLEKRYFRKA